MRTFFLFRSLLISLLCPLGLISIETQVLTEKASDVPSEVIVFTPPKNWRFGETSTLSSSVKTMVIGQGDHPFPPSMNLVTETYSGTLKQYLKRVKEINDSKGYQWKSLGKIRTHIGEASLSQVDVKTVWGDVKMMHVIFQHDHMIYLLTASALKIEFPMFYKDFFHSFRSLSFDKIKRADDNKK